MAEAGGPWVQLAVLCEDWDLDPETSMLTVRNVVNAAWLEGVPEHPEGARIAFPRPHKLLVRLVAGGFVGMKPVEIRSESLGIRLIFEVPFQAEDEPLLLQDEFRLSIQRGGLHWIDVLIGGVVATRIPLRVVALTDPEQLLRSG